MTVDCEVWLKGEYFGVELIFPESHIMLGEPTYYECLKSIDIFKNIITEKVKREMEDHILDIKKENRRVDFEKRAEEFKEELKYIVIKTQIKL